MLSRSSPLQTAIKIIFDVEPHANLKYSIRVVTKISSCRVNTTSRKGIKRPGISFGSMFLLFSNKSSQGPPS